MPPAHYVFRRAFSDDIARARTLWESNRKYFDAETWDALPALLEELLRRELIFLAILEGAFTKLPRVLAGMSFVDPDYVNEARASASTLHNFMFSAAMRGKRAFLGPKQIAIANARGTLNLMNFLGSWHTTDLSDAERANFFAVLNDGYRFFHYGYNYKTMWFEVFEAHRATELQTQGMHLDRELPLAAGDTAKLFRLTAEQAQADPYRRFCSLFFPPKPCLRFSPGEQKLLECALQEYSDEDATTILHLSVDAVKKRWRSIYRKVDMVTPELLLAAGSGTARRRMLLHYLRHHLEELRPYRDFEMAFAAKR